MNPGSNPRLAGTATKARHLVQGMGLGLRVVGFAISALGFQLSAFSAPTVSATVEPAEIRPGSYATFTITIEGGRPDAVSPLKLPDGVQLASSAPSFGQQTTINNGNVRQSATLTWQITSSTAGEHTIPEQELHVGGVPCQTNATKLVVKDNPAYPVSQFDPIMTLETAKLEFYAGEVVPITANLYVHRKTALRRVGLIELPKDNFAIQRFPLQGEESTIMMGGVPYRALAYQSTLSALKPGKFKLGPATSEIIIEVPTQEDRFQHPFFSQTEPRKVRPQCNDIEVTVIALPDKGRPKSFTGAVGDFEISMSAEPKELAVGDPISVEMTITGTGNFDSITAPAITEPEAWKLYPARKYSVQSTDSPSDGQMQRMGFTQVIIPKKKIAGIPPFEFSYFSPSKKAYVTLRTEAQSLNIKAAEQPIEPPPATAASTTKGQVGADSDKVPTVKPKITDILTVLPKESAWLAARPALARDRTFLLANLTAAGVLALLILGKVGFASWQAHKNSPSAPAHRLWRQLHDTKLTCADFYSLAASYIALRGLDGEEVHAILERHNAINYGRPTPEAGEAPSREERERVLSTLKNAPVV